MGLIHISWVEWVFPVSFNEFFSNLKPFEPKVWYIWLNLIEMRLKFPHLKSSGQLDLQQKVHDRSYCQYLKHGDWWWIQMNIKRKNSRCSSNQSRADLALGYWHKDHLHWELVLMEAYTRPHTVTLIYKRLLWKQGKKMQNEVYKGLHSVLFDLEAFLNKWAESGESLLYKL